MKLTFLGTGTSIGVPAKFIKKADPAQTAEINKKIANNYAMYASWYR